MKTFQKYLPLVALAAGFVNALLAAGVHSSFFALLPLLAFAFGYFATWRRGLLNGLLLFAGYGLVNPRLLDLFQYFYAFICGGFIILVIGALAPLVRRGLRKAGAITVLVLLAAVVSWSVYQTLPKYSYYYQIILHTSEEVETLELYLPAGTVSGEIYSELYDSPLSMPGSLTEDYTKELVDTEHGQMLKLTVPEMMEEGPRGYPHTVNIIFEQGNPPHELIKLIPRYDAVPVNEVSWRKFLLVLPLARTTVMEEIKVPVMVKSDKAVDFGLRLENRTGRGERINFAVGKANTYTELISYEGRTGDAWLLLPVAVTERMNIRGIGD